MKTLARLICLFVLLGCLHSSTQQYWSNKKLVSKRIEPAETKESYLSNPQPLNNLKIQENPWYQAFESAPAPVVESAQATEPAPVPVPVPVPAPVVPETGKHYDVVQPHLPHGPFQIQKPVLSYTGEVIIENTIGGIQFDCRGLPTGHWRDPHFCDVFHACVHGYHRKTYTCPIVGLRTYFDERTQKCEFVHRNPAGCSINKYVK